MKKKELLIMINDAKAEFANMNMSYGTLFEFMEHVVKESDYIKKEVAIDIKAKIDMLKTLKQLDLLK